MTSSNSAGGIHIVHDKPAERRESNYIAQVDLAPFELDGQFEQVWLHDLGNGTYALACIPFMLYGLALGDIVTVTPEGRVAGLRASRGHRVLRMLLFDDPDPDRLADAVARIDASVAAAGLASEWHGARFIAVAVPPGAVPQAVFDAMGTVVEEGRGHWEWADARPFA